MQPAVMSRKRRKARKLRGQGITVEVLDRRDIETLAKRWQLDGLALAARSELTHREEPDRYEQDEEAVHRV